MDIKVWDLDEDMETFVQDNLSSILRFTMVAEGSLVQD